MEIQGWVALSFVLGATVAVVIALVVRMRANRRWRATLDERQNAAEVERKALTAEAERAHAELRQQKQELQEDAEARLERLSLQHEAAFQDRRMLVDFLKDRARRSIETELVSREAILRASETLGLNGVLATRTFILVQEGMSTNRHVIQLDHVLLTDAGALLVDHRTWDGIIFDGVRPSEAQPTFGNLIDDVALRPPFALRITSGAATTPDSTAPAGGAAEGSLRVLTHLGQSAPRSQALAHATHLARLSEQTLGESIAVDTCVFYSNATATVYTDAATLTPSADRTAVVADEAEFLDLLTRRERARRRPLEVEQIERLTALLHEQGAKIDAFGDYARLMPAAEPLDEADADAGAGAGADTGAGAGASADRGAEALVPAGSVSG